VLTDGNGSKTKLNAVLSAYGVNYNMLREIYIAEAKVAAVQAHLYGENASLIGDNLKTEYLEENYVHFRQILLASYKYVYETDANGDVIYYVEESDANKTKSHIYYDVYNGVKDEREGEAVKDKNGDEIYYLNDGQYKTIAYDSVHGVPNYVMTKDGDYKTEDMTEDELKALKARAETLAEELKGCTQAEFEKAMKDNSDDAAEDDSYDDGYYLKKGTDYSSSGEDYLYLDTIVEKLEEMEEGEICLVTSKFGYHLIRKYPHTEKAYDKEENEAWFDGFHGELVEKLFLELCQNHFGDIQTVEETLKTSPTMREVGINYYY